jgi:hypothetical protein
LISLSTLRRGSRLPATQDSLPAAGPALPDGIGYPQGSLQKVSSLDYPPFLSFLAQCVSFYFLGDRQVKDYPPILPGLSRPAQ